MFNRTTADIQTTLVQLVTQVSESRQSTNEAIQRTREDIGKALTEIRALEQNFADIKTQLVRNESIPNDIKELKTKAEGIEDRLAEVVIRVDSLSKWRDDITQQNKDDARTIRDKIIDYILKAIIFCMVSGGVVVIWKAVETKPVHLPPVINPD